MSSWHAFQGRVAPFKTKTNLQSKVAEWRDKPVGVVYIEIWAVGWAPWNETWCKFHAFMIFASFWKLQKGECMLQIRWSLSVATRQQDLNYCRKFIVWALHTNQDGAVRVHFDTSTESSHVYNQKSQNCETSVMMKPFALFTMLHMFVMGGFKNHRVTTSAHLGVFSLMLMM